MGPFRLLVIGDSVEVRGDAPSTALPQRNPGHGEAGTGCNARRGPGRPRLSDTPQNPGCERLNCSRFEDQTRHPRGVRGGTQTPLLGCPQRECSRWRCCGPGRAQIRWPTRCWSPSATWPADRGPGPRDQGHPPPAPGAGRRGGTSLSSSSTAWLPKRPPLSSCRWGQPRAPPLGRLGAPVWGGAGPGFLGEGHPPKPELGRDRKANPTLYRIVLSRKSNEARTKAHVIRLQPEGRTTGEIVSALKRHVAREVYRHLLRPTSRGSPRWGLTQESLKLP